ncbi:DUF2141 domain-containing protein [Marixanthomonas spongiae]|uniref:DUF2141 domain-containing protein n=1 Tax=Marixanthomonas spongiae TaxID=2174845 RepID=A0A2U0I3Z6_9FLAO|nr:DUF2141 domain-containing protein [Marixanthomonas spongiae]PVW15710.1 hypothetical protein DDV96_05415 [Marixanthomonas spongiae]
MQTIITTVVLVLSSFVLQAQNTIKVKMLDFDNDKGHVLVGLYDTQEHFLDKAFMSRKATIENNTATVTFTNVPDGVYAVSCFHDEDDNEKLNMFMGMMPTEDYGTSKNAPANFGPPKWKDAKFEVKNGETKIFNIKL